MHYALLIDDETTARADLRNKLEAHPEVKIVAEASTVGGARTLLARTDYDLVFLDIHLIGGNAFDLVAEVKAGARIIFVTAYDSYALRAFEINALDYLLKPVAAARLEQALHRCPMASDDAPEVDEVGTGGKLRLDDTVFLRSGGTARFVSVDTISAISAQDNYSEVRLTDGGKVFLRKSLKAWEACLPESHFMRVHRTQIVNLAQIVSYSRDQDEHTRLEVQGLTEEVSASRERWSELRLRLQGLRRRP
jgi:two-component system LytT family response regulator